MIVSMDSRYTLNDEDFTVLTVTKPGKFPVLGYTPSGNAYQLQANGTSVYGRDNLVEVSPYADFKIDEPVMVRDADNESWWPRFFAGVNSSVIPTAWDQGCTQWSSEGMFTEWKQCRRPTADELAK